MDATGSGYPGYQGYQRRAQAPSGLLEVIALHPADAEAAEAGGADRLELVSTM